MPFFGMVKGLIIGLVFGQIFGLLIALTLGLGKEQLRNRDILFPNEGIRRSLIYGLLLLLFVGLLTEFVMVFGLSSNWLDNLPFALLFGLLIGQPFGLSAALRHYTLRFWLARTHAFPLNAVPFLVDATKRNLLRRVGGGYSFTHRLLLEYLADLDTTTPSPSADTPPVPPTAQS